MHLDHNLNWDTHILKLENKLSCYSGILYRINGNGLLFYMTQPISRSITDKLEIIRDNLSTNALKMICFSLVYSHQQQAVPLVLGA